jgi:hypothetical protein
MLIGPLFLRRLSGKASARIGGTGDVKVTELMWLGTDSSRLL